MNPFKASVYREGRSLRRRPPLRLSPSPRLASFVWSRNAYFGALVNHHYCGCVAHAAKSRRVWLAWYLSKASSWVVQWEQNIPCQYSGLICCVKLENKVHMASLESRPKCYTTHLTAYCCITSNPHLHRTIRWHYLISRPHNKFHLNHPRLGFRSRRPPLHKRMSRSPGLSDAAAATAPLCGRGLIVFGVIADVHGLT